MYRATRNNLTHGSKKSWVCYIEKLSLLRFCPTACKLLQSAKLDHFCSSCTTSPYTRATFQILDAELFTKYAFLKLVECVQTDLRTQSRHKLSGWRGLRMYTGKLNLVVQPVCMALSLRLPWSNTNLNHSVSDFIGTFNHRLTFIRRPPGGWGALKSCLLRLLARAGSESMHYLWLLKALKMEACLSHKTHFYKLFHECLQSKQAWFLVSDSCPPHCEAMHVV